jgi:hypothetical protein
MVSSQNEEDLLLLFFGEKRVSFIFLATMGSVNIDIFMKKPKVCTFGSKFFQFKLLNKKAL